MFLKAWRAARSWGSLVAAVVPVAAGCDGPGPSASFPHSIRDSAGIRIVENLAPEWEESFWTVDPEPEFALGGELGREGDASSLVWDIVAAGVLSDGRVVLLSPPGERKVLIFERSGVLSTAFGRAGRGPGEFSGPQHLQVLPGDTIVVWDYMFGPVAYFDASGKLLRQRALDLGRLIEVTRGSDQHIGETVHLPLSDGSFITRIHRPGWSLPEEGETYRRPVGYVRIDPFYNAHPLGWWEGHEFLNHRIPILPFPVQSLVTGGGTPFAAYITNGDRFEVHQFAPTGRIPHRVIRRPIERIPIESARARDLAEMNSDVDRDWQSWERAVARAGQRYYPVIASMQVDAMGYLWVLAQWGRRPDGLVAWQWSVFDEGRWLGDVAMPDGVLWIGEDLVLARHVDPGTGLEQIVGYRLDRHTGRSGPPGNET